MQLTRRQSWLLRRVKEGVFQWGCVGFVVGCVIGAVSAGAAVLSFALHAGIATVACAAIGAAVALINPTPY